MPTKSEPRTYGRSPSVVPALSIGLLCVAVFAGYAWAQGKPTDPEPKGKAEPPVTVKPAPKSKGTSAVRPDSKSKPPSPVKNRGRASSTFQMDPNAKWVCDQLTAALEPVWRSDKSLTFTFNIRNEGTADLKIRAKGG